MHGWWGGLGLALTLTACGGRVDISSTGIPGAAGSGGATLDGSGGATLDGSAGTLDGGGGAPITDSAITEDSPFDAGPGCIAQLAAGSWHTCALKTDGTLWCWGWNETGELGDGTQTTRLRPVQVQALGRDVVQVAPARTYTCALKANGTLWCWGFNGCGQLGLGTTGGFEPIPQRVTALGDRVAEIAAGSCHACARDVDDAVWCWGLNDHGELGNATTESVSAPTRSLLDGASSLASGKQHQSCAIRKNGSLWCWGQNSNGELGDGTVTDADPYGKPTPVQVALAAPTGDPAMGSWHVCARASDQLWCWGGNWAGQLGNGTTLTPEPLPMAIGVPRPAGIAAGGYHSCAFSESGGLWCWGRNEHGQVGQPNLSNHITEPTEVPGLTGVVEVATGDMHSCARTKDDRIWCWGHNEYGQLGNGTTASAAPSPTPVELPCP